MSAVYDLVRELLRARTAQIDLVRFTHALAHVAARRQLYLLVVDLTVDGETLCPMYVLACTHSWRAIYYVVHAASKARCNFMRPMADGVSPLAALFCSVHAKACVRTCNRHRHDVLRSGYSTEAAISGAVDRSQDLAVHRQGSPECSECEHVHVEVLRTYLAQKTQDLTEGDRMLAARRVAEYRARLDSRDLAILSAAL